MAKSLITSVLLFLLAACGGKSGDPAEQLRQFCERWNDARCAMAAECGGFWSAGCTATCDDPEWQRTFERLEQGRVRYDTVAAMDCLDGMKLDSCSTPASCGRVLTPAVDPGGACGSFEDCKGDAECRLDGSCPGVCVARPGPGDPCSQEGLSCRSGSFCHAFDGRCLAYVEEGGACDGDISSGVGIIVPGEPRPPPNPDQLRRPCDHRLACVDGRCRPPPPRPEVGAGEACRAEICTDGDCRLEWIADCTESLFCNWGTGQCTPLGTIGQPCPEFVIGSGSCVEGLSCFESRCTPIAVEGDACEGWSCPGGLPCIEGTCSGYPAVGEACIPGASTCEVSRYSPMLWYPVSTYCDEDRGICVEMVLGGEPCGGGDGICDGRCEDGVCQAYLCGP